MRSLNLKKILVSMEEDPLLLYDCPDFVLFQTFVALNSIFLKKFHLLIQMKSFE